MTSHGLKFSNFSLSCEAPHGLEIAYFSSIFTHRSSWSSLHSSHRSHFFDLQGHQASSSVMPFMPGISLLQPTPVPPSPQASPPTSLTATHPSGLSLVVTAWGGLLPTAGEASSPYGMSTEHSVFSFYNTYDSCNFIVKLYNHSPFVFSPPPSSSRSMRTGSASVLFTTWLKGLYLHYFI